ncbi:ankyrin-2 [Musca domestica]|uniref:Ankyrin-2 n=2 Tax=Musca domestica TaxID=7370 RepID=A0A1I8NCT1_MUSDO|nr:ankyrin-2 [Musca domestica]XP_011294513.1 ankyrin-2 [Musca domestica]XP_058975674.1 ankyrin-2 [Musca domestica]
MGGSVSQIFRSGSALLSHRDGHKVSKETTEKITTLFEILRANPKISIQPLESLLLEIPKNENILVIHDDCGFNILQRAVGLNHVELTKWLLQRHRPDVNRSPCSLPLHIACLKGHESCVELLLKYGARIECDSRMCFPGSHSSNCELFQWNANNHYEDVEFRERNFDNSKLQNAICYAIDGDQINVLNILVQKLDDPWIPFRSKRPVFHLLHMACERGAWNCVQQLVVTRSDEINLIKDEYYPIHHAVLHDMRFLELLIQHGAVTTVRTCTQQFTLLHMVIFIARKSAEDTLSMLRILLERGCKELINEPDVLGNTPLHSLIVRYALEEARYGYDKWSKWDVLHLVRFLLQHGAKNSINQAGNSALACVFRHIRDMDVCFELLSMMIEDSDPNIVGRDGSVPIMVLLIPLINKDTLQHYTHSMKVCFVNCIRILLQHGANPNCSYHHNLTPLQVLVFTVSENFTLSSDTLRQTNFDFIKNILLLLLQHGLDCNQTYQNILQAVMDMVRNVRDVSDLNRIHDLTLTLIQYGADPNIVLSNMTTGGAIYSNEIARFGDALGLTGSSSESNGAGGAGTVANSGNTNGNSSVGETAATRQSLGDTSFRNSFRTNSRYLLFYYIVLITKKDFILNDPDVTFTRIILLFYATMQHDTLYNCLKSLHNFYVAQVPSKKTEQLIAVISSLYRKPRSLKQLSRLAIYESLNRKLAQNVNKLKLPGMLKDYVLNFDK